MKKKVLFILHYCPPVFGSNVVGSMIKESESINRQFLTRYIKIKTSSDIDKIGHFEPKKILYLTELMLSTLLQIVVFHPDKIYFTPSVKGSAFYRDFMLSLILKCYCSVFRKELFYHYHAKGINEFTKKSKLNFALTKIFLKKVNIILISEYLSSDLENIKGYRKLLFLNNGIKSTIDDNELELVQEKRKADNTIKILFLSNLKETKGTLVTLEAFKKVYELVGKSIRLAYVGGFSESDTYDTLKKRITESNIESVVEIAGPRYDNDKTHYLSEAHILIFPTFYPKETFGLVNLEAMCYGLPVISSFEGGVPDVVEDGVTGFLVDPHDVNLLAEKLEFLINNPIKRYDMGMKGRARFLEKFQIHNFEQNLINILNEISSN